MRCRPAGRKARGQLPTANIATPTGERFDSVQLRHATDPEAILSWLADTAEVLAGPVIRSATTSLGFLVKPTQAGDSPAPPVPWLTYHGPGSLVLLPPGWAVDCTELAWVRPLDLEIGAALPPGGPLLDALGRLPAEVRVRSPKL